MTKRLDSLQQYVGDMLAVERGLLNTTKHHSEDMRVAEFPQASRTLERVAIVAQGHVKSLEQHLTNLGGDAFSPVKEGLVAALGTAGALFDKVRSNKVSKMLRDDYTALSLAVISYTMLHTTGLALRDEATAHVALRHMKAWTPLLTEISEIIAHVVVAELIDESETIDTSVAVQATQNTQEAWRSEHIHSAHGHPNP
jgi:hypothetical protein